MLASVCTVGSVELLHDGVLHPGTLLPRQRWKRLEDLKYNVHEHSHRIGQNFIYHSFGGTTLRCLPAFHIHRNFVDEALEISE